MESHELRFDSRVFSIEAVKNAAYRMAASFDCDIRIEGDDIVCDLKLRGNEANSNIDSLMDQFRREVVDHDLRLQISSQTEAVRNLILAHAFSRTGITTSE